MNPVFHCNTTTLLYLGRVRNHRDSPTGALTIAVFGQHNRIKNTASRLDDRLAALGDG